MIQKEVIGKIACPACGSEMRVTLDKNGDPFGFCEVKCAQQLRVGPNKARVNWFLEKHGLRLPSKAPVTGTVTAPKPAPVPPKPLPEKKPVSEPPKPPPEQKPVQRQGLPGPFDFLTKGATA